MLGDMSTGPWGSAKSNHGALHGNLYKEKLQEKHGACRIQCLQRSLDYHTGPCNPQPSAYFFSG